MALTRDIRFLVDPYFSGVGQGEVTLRSDNPGTSMSAHTHGITDPGHCHQISDPGHSHGLIPIEEYPFYSSVTHGVDVEPKFTITMPKGRKTTEYDTYFAKLRETFGFLDIETEVVKPKLLALDVQLHTHEGGTWAKPEVKKPHVAGLDAESINWDEHRAFMRGL
jgi:hypothetical protein